MGPVCSSLSERSAIFIQQFARNRRQPSSRQSGQSILVPSIAPTRPTCRSLQTDLLTTSPNLTDRVEECGIFTLPLVWRETPMATKPSVSMTTGETLRSNTRMSGRRLLPLSMPVFSELTMSELPQARRVRLSTPARASLIVCSVSGVRFFRPKDQG
jgi:hypothetical protein